MPFYFKSKQKRAAKREEALASFEAWKAMKEKEAKKIAAKKRLEEKNKRKTEEENAVRKSEALQVSTQALTDLRCSQFLCLKEGSIVLLLISEKPWQVRKPL